MNLEERFWAKVTRGTSPNECWQWKGTKTKAGYGTFTIGPGRTSTAHRVAWMLVFGALPPVGMDLDHLCHNKGCVNPAHCEIVTHAENCRRRASRTTHCPRGHPYNDENTRVNDAGWRDRSCDREGARIRRATRSHQREALGKVAWPKLDVVERVG